MSVKNGGSNTSCYITLKYALHTPIIGIIFAVLLYSMKFITLGAEPRPRDNLKVFTTLLRTLS